MTTLYETLGVRRNASAKTIKVHYRERAKRPIWSGSTASTRRLLAGFTRSNSISTCTAVPRKASALALLERHRIMTVGDQIPRTTLTIMQETEHFVLAQMNGSGTPLDVCEALYAAGYDIVVYVAARSRWDHSEFVLGRRPSAQTPPLVASSLDAGKHLCGISPDAKV